MREPQICRTPGLGGVCGSHSTWHSIGNQDYKICRIASRLKRGAPSLPGRFHTDPDSKIAPAKTQLFAYSGQVRRQAQRRQQARAGSATDISCPDLGCEAAAGAPQRRWRQ
eukprot:9032254-Pyramimonas_sp.AAC.1